MFRSRRPCTYFTFHFSFGPLAHRVGCFAFRRYKIIEKEVVVEKEVEKEIIEKIVIGQRDEDIAEQKRLRQGVRGAPSRAGWLVALPVFFSLCR